MKCVKLAWSIESGVWNSIPYLGFTSKNGIIKHSMFGIQSQSQCLLQNVDIEC